jgi:hypothetical protein
MPVVTHTAPPWMLRVRSLPIKGREVGFDTIRDVRIRPDGTGKEERCGLAYFSAINASIVA